MQVIGELVVIGQQAASAIINGLSGGITSGAATVIQAAKNLAMGIINAFSFTLSFGSPSKVFREFGQLTGEGFAIGLDDGQGMVGKAAGELAGAASAEGGTAGVSPGGGLGGVTVNATITVEGSASPTETAEAIRDILAEQIGSTFEQFALEAGV